MPLEILGDDLAPDTVVAGRYRLERIVGEGGMGIVWAARHVLTGKACALKFLKGRRAHDPRSHERLLREARAACAVRHPNVAQVHDILELPSGSPFIVMDLLEGESLAARIAARGRLEPAEALRILRPVVDAVLAAHELGIIHRDLKPDNVFLEREATGGETVQVLDFGIAKFAQASDDEIAGAPAFDAGREAPLTSTLSALGTPRYMAPEQLAPEPTADARADVWALGVIAFECLTGVHPPGDPRTRSADEVRRALERTGRELADVVARMLEPDAARRPTLAEVRATFARCAEARPPPPSRRALAGLAVLAASATAAIAFGAATRRADAITRASAGEPPPAIATPIATPIPTASGTAPPTAAAAPTPAASTTAKPRASAPPVAKARPPAPASSGEPIAPPIPSATATSSTRRIPTYERK